MSEQRTSRKLPDTLRVSLAEALTWIAFRDALPHNELRLQVEGYRPPSTESPEERIRRFYETAREDAPDAPGFGHFEDRERGLLRLSEAWLDLREAVERGVIKVRGRFTARYSVADARLAYVGDLTGPLLETFLQFDVSTGGIRRQQEGSPDVLWQDHPKSKKREFDSFDDEPDDDARLCDGYLMVEVDRAELVRQFSEPVGSPTETDVPIKRKRPGPAPDPYWPIAIARVARECIKAGYKRRLKRGGKAAIQIMLLDAMAEQTGRAFSEASAATHALKVIAELPDG